MQFIHDLEEVMVFMHHLDKFVKSDSIKKTVVNLLGGNMKIVEDYAQRIANDKVEESMKQTVLNMFENGCSVKNIVNLTGYNLDFVKKVLSK